MYKVLIVEDDPMVAMINEQYVKRHSAFTVSGICRDGQMALDFLEKETVDLVILDVFMPHMDGLTTLQLMRKKQLSVDAILVTAANDRDSLEKALHLGVVDYLVKPFTMERFRLALDKFISQRDTLKDEGELNQESIDTILGSTHSKPESIRPKGIQEKTLQLLLTWLRVAPEEWVTVEEIAEGTGLTNVTVRRYMQYLTERGTVVGEMNYETGGRPCMMYRIGK